MKTKSLKSKIKPGMTADEIIDVATDRDKIMAVCRKISTQRPPGNESEFIFSVFAQAVRDAAGSQYKKAARYELSKPKYYALELLGIDTEWARGQFQKAGVPIMGESK